MLFSLKNAAGLMIMHQIGKLIMAVTTERSTAAIAALFNVEPARSPATLPAEFDILQAHFRNLSDFCSKDEPASTSLVRYGALTSLVKNVRKDAFPL